MHRAPVVPPLAVLLPPKRTRGLVVFRPEEPLHLRRDLNLAPVVVDGGIRQVGIEDDTILRRPAGYAPPEVSGVHEYRATWASRALAPLPRLAEKRLPLEVAVELLSHLHPDILQDVSYNQLGVPVHYRHS